MKNCKNISKVLIKIVDKTEQKVQFKLILKQLFLNNPNNDINHQIILHQWCIKIIRRF